MTLLFAVSASAVAGLLGLGHLEGSLREVTEIDARRLLTVTHIRRLFRSELVLRHKIDQTQDAAERSKLLTQRDELHQERAILLDRLKRIGVVGQDQALRGLQADHESIVRLGSADNLGWERAVATILLATQNRLDQAAAEARRKGAEAKLQLIIVSGLASAIALGLSLVVLRHIRLASEILSEREAQFRSVVQSAPSLLAILSSQGDLRYLPPRGPIFLGLSLEQITKDPLSWIELEDRATIAARCRDAAAGIIEPNPTRVRGIRGDGSYWIAAISVTKLEDPRARGAQIILQILDITEQSKAESTRRELEQQLRQAQKMETVGRLAGGVAHDFNNLLTAVKGYASLAQQEPLSPEVPEYVEAILAATDRAAELTRQLLTFSRKHVISPVVTDLGTLVSGLRRLLLPIVGEDVRLEIEVGAELGMCSVDRNQVEQVVLNLAINARHAMPNGGTLRIELANAELDEGYTVRHADVPSGPYVLLSVSDTGMGMSKEIREHAFEPFFTTKPLGQGTGLGLSVVYGTVQQHGGTIDVYSEPGLGTTFRIYWPRVASIPASDARLNVAIQRPRGNERILLVEDDPLVRSFAAKTLTQQGYVVTVAETAQEALNHATAAALPPELLLTDVILADQPGPLLAQELCRRFHGLPVLFASGYSEKLMTERGQFPAKVDYLHKPFDAATLARRVRDALDRAGSSAV